MKYETFSEATKIKRGNIQNVAFFISHFMEDPMAFRKTSSLKKRRTITGDPKGKDKGKGDIYTKVAIPRYRHIIN